MKKIYILLLLFITALNYAQPLNDECANATLLTVSASTNCTTSASGTLQEATASGGSLNCAGTAIYDVWYQFVATNERHGITISDVAGIGTAIRFEMYEGSCSSSSIYCGSSGPSYFPANLNVGQIYFIRVYPYTTPVNQNITFNICITVPGPAIITSDTDYTISELVNDVLINTEGVTVSNVTSSTGTDFGSANGLGYFNNNETEFAFSEGIILSTGSIITAPGPNTGPTSGGNNTWPGDTDLYNILTGQSTLPIFNATSLEFDFVANGDLLIIDYIFASKEYGVFQCLVNDSFAIILTDISTGMQQNLAVVPGTTIPVSVATVRNILYNPNCTSANPQYFGTYYAPTNTTSPVNFNGITVPLTAEASIIPGNNYHIKFVIADRSDIVIDSALFLSAFSIFTGELNLGEPHDLISCDDDNDGTAIFDLTQNTSFILDQLNESYYTVTYHETLEMAENNSSAISNSENYLNVNALSTDGTQTIYVRVTNNSSPDNYAVTSFELFANPTPEVGETEPIIFIDTDMDFFTTIDLTIQENDILSGLSSWDYSISYYPVEQDAFIAANPIINAMSYYTTSNTIFYRLENNNTGCFTIGSFNVVVLPSNYETPEPTGSSTQTFNNGDTLANLVVEGQNIQWYASQNAAAGRSDDTPLPMSTLLVDGTTYYASQTIYGIESINRLPVTVNLSLNTQNNAFNGLLYYPNPVNDILTISNGEDIDSITVFNLLGQSVINKQSSTQTAEVNFSSLPAGMYLIKVVSAGKEKILKVSKN